MTQPNDKMTGKQMFDLAVESGLQLVPFAGGSLATLYFGSKQTKQFNRIESFYAELAEKVNALGSEPTPLNEQQQEELTDLIDEVNEKVEREASEQKRKYLQNFLLHSLNTPDSRDFDTKKFFLDALGTCNELDLEILAALSNNPINQLSIVGSISKPGVEQYAIVGSIGRLKNLGFISAITQQVSIGLNEDNALSDAVGITPFGKQFVEYCMQE